MVPRYDLTRLKTRAHLINLLGIDDRLFDHAINFQVSPDPTPEPERNAQGFIIASIPAFFRHEIPKKNRARGYRLAWEPALLKPAYKKLARLFSKFFEYQLEGFPHPSTYGYLGGRGTRGNAKVHCGRRHLFKADIEAFFPSIPRSRIQSLFLQCGFSDEVADLLSRFVTIDDCLPLGLPTSPVLSNATFLPVDHELQALAVSTTATYTRYSDDLSFSGEKELPALDAISTILGRYDFTLAVAKTRRSVLGQSHYVTGLSIDDPAGPHAPRQMKRRLRQELYYAEKFGLYDHLTRLGINGQDDIQRGVNRLDGTVKYVGFHEPNFASRLKPQWRAVLQTAGAGPSYPPRHQNSDPFFIAIDEAEYSAPEGRLLVLGLTVTQRISELNTSTNDVLQDFLADLFAAGKVETLEERGLHFADATKDLRLRYAERLAAMPFEGYVVYGRLTSPRDYEATYLRLLGAVVRRRMMAAESLAAHFIVEANQKVSQSKINDLIQATRSALEAEHNRRPVMATVQFVTKPNLAISPPDFLLGFLGLYLASKDAPPGHPEPWDRLIFERVRDKCRLILDIDNGTEFSRRRPILPWASPEPVPEGGSTKVG